MKADPVFTSYSANFEDVLLHRIFGDRAEGAYLDAGASDPVRGNDTKALYDRGWSGVNLVDPVLLPRFARARPRDRNVGVGPGPVPPDLLPADAGPVALVRLAGGAALRDAQWERLRPDLVVAETADRRTGRCGPGPGSVLERHGYDLAHFDGLNEFHVKRGFRGAEGAFALPPNLFDRFVLHRLEDAAEGAPEEMPGGASKDACASGPARAERLALDNADLRHEAERLRASVAALTADMLALNRDLDGGLAERAELHGLRGVAEECSRLRAREQEAWGREQEARALEQEARGREQEACAREQEARGREQELRARVQEVDAYAHTLEAELGRVRAELEHVRGLYEFMTVQHGHINALHGQTMARHEQALARYEQAEAERRRLAALYEQEHALRQALEASTSWRLTRPLRTVVERVRGR